MSNPEVTLFAAAARPHHWGELYNRIGKNEVPFEIVFVGPTSPSFDLPDNFRFIQSTVKPTQAFEIARRNAKAPLVMNISDDCNFVGEHPIDRLYAAYLSYHDENLILSCRYMIGNLDRRQDHLFFVKDPTSPVMPMHSFMSQKLYDKVGGVDRNFIAVMWDLDIAMRVYAIGGRVEVSDVSSNETKEKNSGINLCAEFWLPDRPLLERLWSVNGKTHFNQTQEFDPFDDENILTVTQGPKGRWR